MRIIVKIFFLTTLIYFSCENNPATYEDCNGVPNGPSNEDNCGVCDNNPLNDCIQDCNKVWGGNATIDDCGICDDNPLNDGIPSCQDPTECILPDDYGSYNSSGMDCFGVCGGTAVIDECGRCNGEGSVYICGCDQLEIGKCDCAGNELDCTGECPAIYEIRYKCIDQDNNIGDDCNPDSSECSENSTCQQSWIESVNSNYTGSVYDDCGDCMLPDDALYFSCSDGSKCNSDNENECEGKFACSSEFIDNYSGQPIAGDCLLRSVNDIGNCDCLGIGNNQYNYHGECGGPDIDPTVYDCDYSCIATGEGLEDDPESENYGKDECGVCNGTGNINGFCACEDLAVNTMHLVQDESETNKLYLLYKTDTPIYGIEMIIDGATILSSSGGDAAAASFFTTGAGDKLLGFSFSGGSIPINKIGDDGNLYGCGVLTEMTVLDANSIIGVESYVISSAGNYIDIYDHNDITIVSSILNDNSNVDCYSINESNVSWEGELITQQGQSLIRNIGKITSVEINGGLGSNCYLNTIPSDFYNLNMLQNLDLSNNAISTISNDIEKLINVTTINFSNNQLSEIPDKISDLSNLVTLNLSSNQFTDFPSSLLNISAGHNISLVDLSNNQLTSIPNEICSNNIGSAVIDVSNNVICQENEEVNFECLIYNDTDEDKIPNECDTCPLDPLNDADDDTVCGDIDICEGHDDNIDQDQDGTPYGCDLCQGFDDAIDTDSDTVPDGCDLCEGFDDLIDSDNDTIPDECDICNNFDDLTDTDTDTVPDGCDLCQGFDDAIDTDSDTVPDGCDLCEGFDDNMDIDNDGIPYGCDICADFDDLIDTDNDTIPDGCDICEGFDDLIDTDDDTIPDGCDTD